MKFQPRGWLFRSLMIILMSFIFISANAARKTAVGYWATIDNMTGKHGGIIKIWRSRGKYYGKIVKTGPYQPGNLPRKCVHCRDKRRGKSYVGLTILKNLVWEPSSRRYVNGLILDPRTGKEYRCYMTLVNNGNSLRVRGYVGISLLGKTTVWTRVGSRRRR
ncbi:MAG: DUF2147 domain-containing protein [Gammaproteobacteria bacterium]|nr:DUF2147 domain-containing protein [Gammaproteobacteria bacterium]